MLNPQYITEKELFNKPLKKEEESLTLREIYGKEKDVLEEIKQAFQEENMPNLFQEDKWINNEDKIIGKESTFRESINTTMDSLKFFSIERTITDFSIVNYCKNYFLNQIKIDLLRKVFKTKDNAEEKTLEEIDYATEENMIVAKELHRFIHNNIGKNRLEYNKFMDFLQTTMESYSLLYCQYMENKGRPIRSINPKAQAKAKEMNSVIDSLITNIKGMGKTSDYLESKGFEVFYPSEEIDKKGKIDLVARGKRSGKIVLCQIKSKNIKSIDIVPINGIMIEAIKQSTLPEDDSNIMDRGLDQSQKRKIENDWKVVYEFAEGLKENPDFTARKDKIFAFWVKAFVKSKERNTL